MLVGYESVKEAKYLVIEGHQRYRRIVRYLFTQHEKFRYQIFRREIIEHIRSLPEFGHYPEEQAENDLKTLEGWGNLIVRQDNRHVKSIAEFNRKNYRYQLTPLTVVLERALEEFQNSLQNNKAGLDATLFERLLQKLQQLAIKHLPNKEDLDVMWEEMLHYFKELSQNAIDFFAEAEDLERIMVQNSTLMLARKHVFLNYLENFIVALQKKGPIIERLLQEVEDSHLDQILDRIVQYRIHEKPAFVQKVSEETLYVQLRGQWEGLRSWFSSKQEESEQNRLQQTTIETVRKFTTLILRIGELQTPTVERKNEYLYLAKKFLQTGDLEEAHKFSASVFGVMSTKHFLGVDFPSDQIVSLWEGAPHKQTTKPYQQRHGGGMRFAGEVRDRTEEKQALLREREEEGRYEEELLNMLVTHKKLTIEQLGLVHPKMRRVILNWLTKSSRLRDGRKHGMARGIGYVITKRSDQEVQMRCLDGTMMMPDYEISLRGVRHGE